MDACAGLKSPSVESLPDSSIAQRLAAEIRNRSAVVGVMGLGHVGLPLSQAFAEKGFRILGLDVDGAKVRALGSRGLLPVTDDFDRLVEADVILICVPTPLNAQRVPDLSCIASAGEIIRSRLRPGQLVVLESTTYPGTTEEILAPLLTERGLVRGEDYFLAYSPSREDPGNQRFSHAAVPKILGSLDEVSGVLAQALYGAVFPQAIRLSSARAAEATKLFENVFRAVNIALVNELKVVYDRMGIDIWEVLDAAETKPFGFMRFNPGPGWGGHCIPLDPFYLSWKAREYGEFAHFIELAGEINTRMPQYVVGKLTAALNERARALKGSRILVMGLSYKRDIADWRESPAFEIIRLLLGMQAIVDYHDPHISRAPKLSSWPGVPPLESVPLTPEILALSDAVVLVTDHSAIDYEMVARHSRLIIDTRGVYPRHQDNVVKA